MTGSEIFTLTSLLSSLGLVALLFLAFSAAKSAIPEAPTKDKLIFVWLVFDGLVHFVYEGSWIWLSFPAPRTVNNSVGVFAEMWREYTRADTRWGVADPGVLALELLTVFVIGPMCFYIVYLMAKKDMARQYWMIVLCTSEIYGGWMTFCPEWLAQTNALNPENSALHLYFYLWFLNGIWVVIPAYLLFDSWKTISLSLRSPEKYMSSCKQISKKQQ